MASTLKQYKRQLDKLIEKRQAAMREAQFATMMHLDADIAEIREKIAEEEKYQPRPARELLTKEQAIESGLLTFILEAHLAADFVADCAYKIKFTLDKFGLCPVSFIDEIELLRETADKITKNMMDCNDALADLLLDNETLIEALHKKVMSYIMQRSKSHKAVKNK